MPCYICCKFSFILHEHAQGLCLVLLVVSFTLFYMNMYTYSEADHLHRAEAVIALKRSTEQAQRELQSGNQKREQRHQRERERSAQERSDILATGGNPEGVVL